MQKNSTVTYAQQDSIATLTLNHPEKHNAFNGETVALLDHYFQQAEQDKHVRIILLTANGKNFCAGADLNWMKAMATAPADENLRDAQALASLFQRVADSPKATLALVHGAVMGGGCGLAACADIVIASEDARFCFSEVKLGLIPATIAPYVLRRLGYQATRRYFLTAEALDAHTAHQLGLVDELVPLEQLPDAADRLTKVLLRNGPEAIIQVKKLLQRILPVDPTLTHDIAQRLAEIRHSPEAQEGMQAFLAKRNANWCKES